MMLYVLDNNDSIIHHEADSQHHGKQRQGVDGKSQEGKGGKGSHQGYRHCQHRDESCPPALQEYEYNDHNQQQGLEEGLYNLLDGFTDVFRTIDDFLVLEIRRKILGGFLQQGPHLTDSFHGIRVIGQLDTKADAFHAIDL